jgi:hypothetical protein
MACDQMLAHHSSSEHGSCEFLRTFGHLPYIEKAFILLFVSSSKHTEPTL